MTDLGKKIVAGIVGVGTTAVIATGVVMAQPTQSLAVAPSSAAVSSSVVSVQSSEVVSTTEISSASTEVSSIAEPKIVSKVAQRSQTVVSSTASVLDHKVTCDPTPLDYDVPDKGIKARVKLYSGDSKVDESGKCILINYSISGWEGKNSGVIDNFKPGGLTVKNAAGADVAFTSGGFCTIKIPYNTLADVAKLYLTYKDQKIEITVS